MSSSQLELKPNANHRREVERLKEKVRQLEYRIQRQKDDYLELAHKYGYVTGVIEEINRLTERSFVVSSLKNLNKD